MKSRDKGEICRLMELKIEFCLRFVVVFIYLSSFYPGVGRFLERNFDLEYTRSRQFLSYFIGVDLSNTFSSRVKSSSR